MTAVLWIKGTRESAPIDDKLWFSDTYVRTKSGWRYVFARIRSRFPPATRIGRRGEENRLPGMSGRGRRFVLPNRKDVALTRFYGTPAERAEERGKIEKSWSEIYKLTDSVPVAISETTMLRYGASATPTFVFVDRKGMVKRYLPTRMTEERLGAAIDELLR